jgi:hypothetical protein
VEKQVLIEVIQFREEVIELLDENEKLFKELQYQVIANMHLNRF